MRLEKLNANRIARLQSPFIYQHQGQQYVTYGGAALPVELEAVRAYLAARRKLTWTAPTAHNPPDPTQGLLACFHADTDSAYWTRLHYRQHQLPDQVEWKGRLSTANHHRLVQRHAD